MEHLAAFDRVGRQIAGYLSEITGFEILEHRGTSPDNPLSFLVGDSQTFETGKITPEPYRTEAKKPNYIGRYLVSLSNHVSFHVFITYDEIGVLVQAGREVILNLDNFRKATRFANCDRDYQHSHVESPESSDAISRIHPDLHEETSLASADNPGEH